MRRSLGLHTCIPIRNWTPTIRSTNGLPKNHPLHRTYVARTFPAVSSTVRSSTPLTPNNDTSVLPSSTHDHSQLVQQFTQYTKDGNPQMAQQTLQTMQSHYDKTGDPLTQPDTHYYTQCITTWAKSTLPNAANHAESLLTHMQTISETNINVRPNIITYNAVMDAWSRNTEDPCAAHKAHAILDSLQHTSLTPDVTSYNTCMNAWAKSRNPHAAQKAEALLHQMTHIYDTTQNPNLQPDLISYTTVIDAWARSNTPDAASEAQRILTQLHVLARDGQTEYSPTTLAFNACMNAWARQRNGYAAEQAERLLIWMMNIHVNVDVISFTTVIVAWARSGEKRSAARAQKILELMEKFAKEGKEVVPDVLVYTACINAWGKSGEKHAGARAEKLLRKMERLGKEGIVDVMPNTITYNAVMSAYANNTKWDVNASMKVERLWREMCVKEKEGEGVKVDGVSVNCVIHAHAKSGRLENAERILRQMGEKQWSHIPPSRFSYGSVINGYARTGNSQCVQELLQEMQSLHEKGHPNMKPNYVDYTALIHAYSNGKHADRLSQTEALLNWMESFSPEDIDMRPNLFTYTAFVKVCVTTSGTDEDQQQAFQVIWALFLKLTDMKYVQLDERFYEWMFKGIFHLLKEKQERWMMAEQIFHKCCSDGLVGDLVVNTMYKNLGKEFMIQVLYVGKHKKPKVVSSEVNWKRLLVPEWTKNVKRTK